MIQLMKDPLKCPNCGEVRHHIGRGWEVIEGHMLPDGTIRRYIKCRECGEHWWGIYKLDYAYHHVFERKE